MAGYGRKVGVALLSAGFFGPAGGSPHTQRVRSCSLLGTEILLT